MELKLRLEVYGEGPHRRRLEEELRRIGVEYWLEGFQPRGVYLEKLSGGPGSSRYCQRGKPLASRRTRSTPSGFPTVVAKPWGSTSLDDLEPWS